MTALKIIGTIISIIGSILLFRLVKKDIKYIRARGEQDVGIINSIISTCGGVIALLMIAAALFFSIID